MSDQINVKCKCGSETWVEIIEGLVIACPYCKRKYRIGKFGRTKETLRSIIAHFLCW